MSREALSTFTDGTFLELAALTSTLVHRETSTTGMNYLRLSGFCRGRKPRKLAFLFNDTTALYATLQPTGSTQLLVPNLPLYNTGNGIDIYCALDQSSSAWTLPTNLQELLIISEGHVTGMLLGPIATTPNAQPILVTVRDSRRSDGDIDPDKGSEALLELSQDNSSVSVTVIHPGYQLLPDSIQTTVSSGVWLCGDVFRQL